ncbi:hypothetical protein [Spiroplasma endosymbiont of Crioceris asparagi]|uniref:hypothetical protein n=1 Tax=Spiroplasma endosymbiont of Crioceris asparagi TaxID=3066286 RepID=UPI0030D08330
MKKEYDNKCFKCLAEMQNDPKNKINPILLSKMQQGIANSDPDDIYICKNHK